MMMMMMMIMIMMMMMFEVGDNLVAVKKYDEAEPIRTPEPELIINDDVFAEIVSKLD